jgi:hypothetical protein
MNQMELVSQLDAAASKISAASALRQPAPTAIKVLMPVWGFRFVRQFLDLTLPTLLAPGNMPALAQSLPCQFVILTSAADEQVIREHHAWQALEKICSTTIQFIDDLITVGNHSTTITLAYVRAIRQSGEDMVNTCFIILVSDYVVADGSLASVLSRVQKGASAVLAGNFQTIAEETIPLLTRKLRPNASELTIAPRELLQWTLRHLHPATAANIVNYGLSHNSHVNRLFWRVDENTLIGRFYLMHPVAIRPEVTDFVIGSSFDYSLVPELCPSNSVEAMTDSDQYLVVELQPREHEVKHLHWGPVDPKQVAISLAEWATAGHRENIRYSLIYHVSDIPPSIQDTVAESDTFIEKVGRYLPAPPQPHRDHHYWLGAIAAHRAGTGQTLTPHDWSLLLGEAVAERRWTVELLWRLRNAFFGAAPKVRPWHPRWLDYRPVLHALARVEGEGEVLVISDSPGVYAQWLTARERTGSSIEIAHLLGYARRQYLPLIGRFETCLLFFREGDLSSSDEILRRIGPLMKSGGHVLISVTNDQPSDPRDFAGSFAYHSGRFINLPLWVTEIQYVRSSYLRWKLQKLMERMSSGVTNRPLLDLPFIFIGVVGTAAFGYLCNLAALRASSEPPRQPCSSVFMMLRCAAHGGSLPLPLFKPEKELPFELPATPIETATNEDWHDREILGIKTNQLWRGDPRQLASMLARYRFVAKLLSGRHDVGEYGCADAFGTRVVLQEVKQVFVYDKDPDLIDDVRRRHSERWQFEARLHDIVQDRLPRSHDSIYSLGAIEEISPQDEDAFAQHLRDSLHPEQDILIVGSSSPESVDEIQPLGVVRRYRRSGARIKALMERYFHTVLLFSMVGETVLAGNQPGAHYLFAVCCSKKK